MNAAARIVTDMRQFDRGLTYIQRQDLHWLDVIDRITRSSMATSVRDLPAGHRSIRTSTSALSRRDAPRFQLQTYQDVRSFALLLLLGTISVAKTA